MLAPTISYNSPLRLVPAPKSRLLLIADSPDRLKELKAEISNADFEITSVGSLEELRAVCRNHHDLAVLDVSSAQIRPALSVLRTSTGHADIPLLVESTRLHDNLGLAGVLPAFRAMACSRAEMLRLMKFYGRSSKPAEDGRSILL